MTTSASAPTPSTVKIGRIGTGTAWHHVSGNATNCNNSGRPQRIHSLKNMTREDAESKGYLLCQKCFR